MPADALPIIRTLLCRAHVPMALRCFDSLRRCHQPPFRLVIHDDGTLTDQDCFLLSSAHPDTTILRRAEADGPVLAALERYPTCRRYRAEHAMALKLFDVPLLSGGEKVVYSDSDVYYLRPFTGYHRLLNAGNSRFVFMRDIKMVYAIRYFHVFGPRRIPFVDRLNAGIMLIDPAAVDLDFLEWILSRLDLAVLPNLIEQTCWAAQAARTGPCRFLFPRQAGFPLPERGQPTDRASIPADRVALHFVTFLRDRLSWLDDGTPPADTPAPVDLETIPAPLLTRPAYAKFRLREQLRYWRQKYT